MATKIEEILLGAINANCSSLERLQEDFAVYKKDLNVLQLHVQLQMLPNLVQTRKSLRRDQPPITKVTSVRTIANVLTAVDVGKAMLPDVATLVKIYYTLPVTTATGERSFSALHCLKTFLRLMMTQPRLNSAMLLHVHKDRCDHLDVMSIANLFISVNERHQHFFGSFD